MILIDFSSIAVAAIMAKFYSGEETTLSEGLIRHTILNTIRKINMRFGPEYGKVIICCDGRNYWRKQLFPYYKIKRKQAHEDSELDWKEVYGYVDLVRKELDEFFPYPVITVNEAEADDIIAMLVFNAHNEKILIISRDKDLKQLQKFENVKQYNTIDDRFEDCPDPAHFLFEHVLKGDSSDSIPNVFSPENSIAIGQRQKPATQKKMDLWYNNGDPVIPEEYKERYKLNKILIDLEEIPLPVSTEILEQFNSKINKKVNIMKYFMKFRLPVLMESIQDFRVYDQGTFGHF